MSTLTVNYLLYHIGWLAVVLGVAANFVWLGSLVAVVLIVLHLAWVIRPGHEMRLLAAGGITGFVTDSLLVSCGLLSFEVGILVDGVAPPWIVLLWIQFATTLRFSLRWLLSYPWLMSATGAIGGPAAYAAGAELGVVSVTGPETFAALAVIWTFSLPCLAWVARRDPVSTTYRFRNSPNVSDA